MPVLADDEPPVIFRRSLQLDLAYERETDGGNRDAEGATNPLLRLIAEIRPERTWSGFAKIYGFSERAWKRGDLGTTTNTPRINRAYLQYDDEFGVRGGRWLYHDERERLIDETIRWFPGPVRCERGPHRRLCRPRGLDAARYLQARYVWPPHRLFRRHGADQVGE